MKIHGVNQKEGTKMSILAIMQQEERGTGFNTDLKLKDVVQFVGVLLTGVIFIVTMNAKIEALTTSVNELRENDNKQSVANDLAIKALQNQVATQTIQISLIQKDLDLLKAKK